MVKVINIERTILSIFLASLILLKALLVFVLTKTRTKLNWNEGEFVRDEMVF